MVYFMSNDLRPKIKSVKLTDISYVLPIFILIFQLECHHVPMVTIAIIVFVLFF